MSFRAEPLVGADTLSVRCVHCRVLLPVICLPLMMGRTKPKCFASPLASRRGSLLMRIISPPPTAEPCRLGHLHTNQCPFRPANNPPDCLLHRPKPKEEALRRTSRVLPVCGKNYGLPSPSRGRWRCKPPDEVALQIKKAISKALRF